MGARLPVTWLGNLGHPGGCWWLALDRPLTTKLTLIFGRDSAAQNYPSFCNVDCCTAAPGHLRSRRTTRGEEGAGAGYKEANQEEVKEAARLPHCERSSTVDLSAVAVSCGPPEYNTESACVRRWDRSCPIGLAEHSVPLHWASAVWWSWRNRSWKAAKVIQCAAWCCAYLLLWTSYQVTTFELVKRRVRTNAWIIVRLGLPRILKRI